MFLCASFPWILSSLFAGNSDLIFHSFAHGGQCPGSANERGAAGHYQKVIFIAFSSKGKKEKKGESPSSSKEIALAL